MKKKHEAGYNERLFAGGLRGRLHGARFHWLRESLRRIGAPCVRVLEIGCFDGRSIDYLPRHPERYLGLDANWEGGVDLGRARYRDDPAIRLEIGATPEELRRCASGQSFDTALALETLEHVAPSLVPGYIDAIADATTEWFVVTVPNEKGPVFLGKYVAKRLFGDYFRYRPSEVWYATIGRMDRVARDDHKGFDWEAMVREIARRFDIVEVSGYPFRRLSPWMNFGVGIIARSRNTNR
jgi:hypothetical protein